MNASRQIGTALGVAVFASLFHDTGKPAAVRVALICAGVAYLGGLVLASMASRAAVTVAPTCPASASSA